MLTARDHISIVIVQTPHVSKGTQENGLVGYQKSFSTEAFEDKQAYRRVGRLYKYGWPGHAHICNTLQKA